MIALLPPAPPLWAAALVLAPAAAASLAALAATRRAAVPSAWRRARFAAAAMVVAAVAVAATRVAIGVVANDVVRIDTVTVAMLGLISLVAWVVVRYSTNYLGGEADQHRYVRGLLATVAAVSVVVVSNHLVLLVVAWAAASVALHGLLTFFGDRPVAVAVAHKKFLLARCADAAMAGAVVAFATTFDTLRIDGIVAAATAAPSLPAGARVGIALVAVAALLKCAQLPFHGWLIQVMEAPTPVSALLHAGVVNLGGVVLLRFAPLVDLAVETRTLLVVVGLFTAVVAGLVMTTRVSVKVALAWSTCAQMGFLMLQCGLGLWEMALLHLLAHSVYKAHAFLGAGGVVRKTQHNQLAPRRPAPAARSVVLGAVLAVVATTAIGLAWQQLPVTKDLTATVWLMLGIVALALVPLTAPRPGAAAALARLAGVLAVPVVYLALHELFARMVPTGATPPLALVALTAAGFGTLFVLRAACLVAPQGRLPQRIRPWIYGGMFLDEAFTRVAFAIWSPPATTARTSPMPSPVTAVVLAAPRPALVTSGR